MTIIRDDCFHLNLTDTIIFDICERNTKSAFSNIDYPEESCIQVNNYHDINVARESRKETLKLTSNFLDIHVLHFVDT